MLVLLIIHMIHTVYSAGVMIFAGKSEALQKGCTSCIHWQLYKVTEPAQAANMLLFCIADRDYTLRR